MVTGNSPQKLSGMNSNPFSCWKQHSYTLRFVHGTTLFNRCIPQGTIHCNTSLIKRAELMNMIGSLHTKKTLQVKASFTVKDTLSYCYSILLVN